jgi:predicted translin family RNA/ssDNA-binding protein
LITVPPAVHKTVAYATPDIQGTEETLEFIRKVYSECSLTYPKYIKENINMNTEIPIGSPVMVKV